MQHSITVLRIGALLIALSIAAGAFGAHGLRETLSPYHMAIYEKAVWYQQLHGIGLVLVGIIAQLSCISSKTLSYVARCFFYGILLFSGSLYLLALTQIRWLGAITPIGGVAFIFGWLILALKITAYSASVTANNSSR